MARLLQKIPSDLNDLNFTWSTRDEFIQLITEDPGFLPRVRSALPNEGEFLQNSNNWARHMFMPTGWQLTAFGCAIMMRAYKTFRIAGPSKDALTGRIIVKLNRLLNGPWYINTTAMYVWDQKINFEIQIFDADLNHYVNTYFPK